MLHVSSSSSGMTFLTEGTQEQQLSAAYAATHLESMCELSIDSQPHVHRMSGIICTIGKWRVDEGATPCTSPTFKRDEDPDSAAHTVTGGGSCHPVTEVQVIGYS